MKIGVLFRLESDVANEMKKIADMGLHSCQITCWDMDMLTPEKAEEVNVASKKYDVEVSTFWCGYRGERIWNFIDGPRTLGIVPADSARRPHRRPEARLRLCQAHWRYPDGHARGLPA